MLLSMQKAGIEYHSCFPHLLSEAFCDGPQGVLGCCIEGSIVAGSIWNPVACHGADIDDVAPLFPPLHVLQQSYSDSLAFLPAITLAILHGMSNLLLADL